MYKLACLLVLLTASFCVGQTTISDYKYAIVPSKFDFLKEKDQFRLNTLTKLFMEKYGFKTFFDTDIQPVDAGNNTNLFVLVENTSGFITTKIKIILKDYKGKVLCTSEIGQSKEKEYHLAYNEAFRKAFKSFENLNYCYNPKNTPAIQNTVENESSRQEINTDILFAQPTPTGFQLVDSFPKVVMKLFKTTTINCFIAQKEAVQGVLILKDKQWFFEFYNKDTLISNKIEVKF